jgi:hypothetical protein
MTLSSQPLPTIGAANSTEDAKIRSLLSEIQGIINGGLDSSNITDATIAEADLAAALATRLGLGSAGRGKSIIATSQARTNVAYGTLATPDKVTVTLPTDGLVFVSYQATWQESVSGAARAAIFLGANQVKTAVAGDSATPIVAPAEAEIGGSGSGNIGMPIATWHGGLASGGGVDAPLTHTGDVTTGQVLGGVHASDAYPTANGAVGNQYIKGGPCILFAAAGSYDVSVQFKASSGTVAAYDRRLWVWTMGF